MGIDIVTRLYDLADLPLLDQLVFSVMSQRDASPVHLHIMLQRFSFTQVQTVRQAMWGLRRLDEQTTVTLHNWDFPAPFDLRAPLLNWGLDVAQGRYFTCLDVHDQLRPHACAALQSRLRKTAAAVALGGTAVQGVSWWGDVILGASAALDGSVAPPVFMIDRTRLVVEDCLFWNDESDGEIVGLIGRLGERYGLDEVCRDRTLAVRLCPLC